MAMEFKSDKVDDVSGIYYFSLFFLQWNSTFLRFALITGGATEKVSEFLMLLKSDYYKHLCFNNHKCIFEHCRNVQSS
jgi:hypothetical protein